MTDTKPNPLVIIVSGPSGSGESTLVTKLRALGLEFVADTQGLPDALADVVLCHHTLEHVLHPPDVLEEIRRLLKPAGRLPLYVPFEREGRYEHFRPAEPNHHLYSWNVQTLGNLVEEAGFGEVGHFIAQGGRRNGIGEGRLGEGTGADRLTRRDVAFYDCGEDFALAGCKWARHAESILAGVSNIPYTLPSRTFCAKSRASWVISRLSCKV